ncbi:MAG TPA: permease [Nitrospiraceae bacterium]|nr:permease [Nitrospiraceae bacterium]
MKRTMDINLLILLSGTVLLAAAVLFRHPPLLGEALQSSVRLLGGVWPELLLGFLLAGLLEVLIPERRLVQWLGGQNILYGILAGWVIGLLLPGGPYLVFPIVANLLKQGAAPGPLIALLTAKVLLSPIRMLSYEAPLLGWPMTLSRLIPGLLIPPLLGLMGQWVYEMFERKW